MTTNHQQTTTNDQKPPANDQKPSQTTNKRLQTTNKRTLATCKRPQTATPARQTKNLTFRFFFSHPVITRNTPILKNSLQCHISGGRGQILISGRWEWGGGGVGGLFFIFLRYAMLIWKFTIVV